MKWRDVPVGGVRRRYGIRFRRVSDKIVPSFYDGRDCVEVEYLDPVPQVEIDGETWGGIEPGTPGLDWADDETEAP